MVIPPQLIHHSNSPSDALSAVSSYETRSCVVYALVEDLGVWIRQLLALQLEGHLQPSR